MESPQRPTRCPVCGGPLYDATDWEDRRYQLTVTACMMCGRRTYVGGAGPADRPNLHPRKRKAAAP